MYFVRRLAVLIFMVPVLCALVIGGLCVTLNAAELSATQAADQTKVRFLSSQGATAVSVDGGDAVPLTGIAARAPFAGVSITANAGGAFLKAEKKEVLVTAAGFEGWEARISAGDQLSCLIDQAGSKIDLVAASNNAAVVRLSFADGAKAEMPAAASARFDLFADGSYYLAGRGVASVDADGQKRVLSKFLPPMAGGPLQRISDGKQGRWQRLTPLVEVTLGEKLDEKVEVLVGDKKWVVSSNAPQRITLPNGTSFEVSRNSKTGFLDWKVDKGFCRFWISGFNCCSVIGITGQQASQAWTAAQGAVDVVNQTDTNATFRELLVRIANRFSVSVNPAITFQYVNLHNCTTFVGASDGTVELYNPESRQVTLLSGGLKTFRGGVPTANLNAPAGALKINWDGKSDVQVVGSAGDFKIAAKTRRTITGVDASQYVIDYEADGKVNLKCINSAYSVQLTLLKDWEVRVGEGDGVSFFQDPATGIFYSTADAGNHDSVVFVTPDGTRAPVAAGGIVTVIDGQLGSTPVRTFGTQVFYEGSGAGGGLTGGSAVQPNLMPAAGTTPFPFGHTTPHVDPARVSQPPVSVVGGK